MTRGSATIETMGVLLLINRPTLSALLTRRGVAVGGAHPAVVVGAADRLPQLRARYPAAAVLALAADARAEAVALEAGADDAAVVGAPDAVLAARVIRLLARAAPPATRIAVGDLEVDRLARAARRAGRALRLLPREFALLDQLAATPGRTVTRAELHRALCGLDFDPGTNVLAVHVSRLRAALDRGHRHAMLHTERGVGYRLVAEPAIGA